MAEVVVLGYRKGLDEALARRGANTFYVVERYKDGLAGQEYRLVQQLEDAQEVLRVIQAAGLEEVTAVVTDREQGVFATALLRNYFGLPGGDYARALLFRDKYLQKSALAPDVRRADCQYLTGESSFECLARALGSPFVVKPANGLGATRTALIATADEFKEYIAKIQPIANIAYVAESYVSGREFHIDGVWHGGRLRWSSVGRYHEPPIVWTTGGLLADQVLRRDDHPDLYRRAERVAEQALASLGAPDGVFHLEAFDNGGDMVFGECGMRVPGALIPEIIRMTYGVDLYELQAALALGEPLDGKLGSEPSPERCYGYVYLRSHEGGAQCKRDFEERFPLVEINFPQDPHATAGIYGKVGHVIVADPDGEVLSQRIADIVAFNLFG
jgi:biotin carboxylase